MDQRRGGDASTRDDTASADTQSSTEPFDRASQPLQVSGYELGLLGNLVTVIAFSRLASPLVITPSVVCGMLLALASHHGVQQRSWVLSVWAAAALLSPLLLEALGVLAPTWRLAAEGIVTWGTIVHSHGKLDLASLVFGQTALVVVVAVYATSFSRAAATAQRAAHRQAWHLQQMIPRQKA